MEFEKAMRVAEEYLTFTPRFMDPKMPQGLWFCNTVAEASAIQINAVCLGSGCDWDDVVKVQPFLERFPYLVIVTPNAIAREEMVKQLRPRLPAMCIYVITDAGFRNCKTLDEFIRTYGSERLLDILEGAEELPAYGILNLAQVPRRDLRTVPRVLSRFPVLDRGIGGFFAGELSVWTGKRGVGKSTILGQLLLEAIDQGHTVCAYSGELPKEQFREWIYLQAAGPDHIAYEKDEATGKLLAMADPMADKQISEWMDERFWLFDLERNTRHDPETISDLTKDERDGTNDRYVSISLRQWQRLETPVLAVSGGGAATERDSQSGAAAAKTYTVRSGDCLWTIAEKYYGSGAAYTKLAAANPAIKNPNLIYPGQVLTIPPAGDLPAAGAKSASQALADSLSWDGERFTA